ncbi:MAG: DUF6941 family protein [Streptosporangiaceae bacterium]
MEYLLLADYVRQDAASTHIMGAGIDTFTVPEGRLPVSVPVGVVARMSFDIRDQVGAEHQVSLIFHGPGDTELLRLTQRLRTPPPAPGIPEHWRTAANLIFRGLLLPLPNYGNDYRLEVIMDDDPRLSESQYVRVVAPEPEHN